MFHKQVGILIFQEKHYLQIYSNVQLLTDQIVNNLCQPVKKHNWKNMAC